MDWVSASNELTRAEKQLANKLRIYKRIICISNLASPDGATISWARLQANHNWHALPPHEFDMDWPNVLPPTSAHCLAFQKALCKTFCTSMGPWQWRSYILETPLDHWRICNRLMLHSGYIDEASTVYHCTSEGILKCKQTSTSKVYEVEELQVQLPQLP